MRYGVVLVLALTLAQQPQPAPAPRFPAAAPVAPPAPPAPAAAPSRFAAPAPAEHLISFDPDNAFAAWSFEGWKVSADGATIKDFGRNEREARQALELIRELRLNQHGVIGGPAPSMEYWLSDGRPPQGPATGLRVLPIDPQTLRVEQAPDQWVLRDDRRVLFGFGGRQADAQQALAVIRKYGFTEVGTVGSGAPSMMVFFTPADPASAAAIPTAPKPPAVPQASTPGAGLDALAVPAVLPLRGAAVSPTTAAAAAEIPDRTPFDWRQVRLRQEGGAWTLAAGSLVLADFGADEPAARLGLAAMQYYRFNEQRRLGGFTYFQVGGQAPRGMMFGLDAQSFQPDRLAVRQVGAGWAVCSGDEPVVRTGNAPEGANAVLDLIQRQQCDRLCRIGQEGKGMTFFVHSR